MQGFIRVTLFLPLTTLKGVRGGSFSWHSAVMKTELEIDPSTGL